MVQTKNPVIEELQVRVEKAGSQKAAADELGIHPSYMTDLLQGKRNPGEELLEKLGFARVVVHVKVNAVDAVMKAIEDVQAASNSTKTK